MNFKYFILVLFFHWDIILDFDIHVEMMFIYLQTGFPLMNQRTHLLASQEMFQDLPDSAQQFDRLIEIFPEKRKR